MIELREVSKTYSPKRDPVPALQPTTLALEPGAILGLLGPNGAGKSTLIRLLALALKPTSGSVYFDGRDCLRLSGSDLLSVRRQIGYLPESPFAYSLLTGREYLTFIGEIHGIPTQELQARIQHLADRLELGEAADRFVRGYSQGTMKKLALIAAMIHRPPILLLDEPTNSLDPAMVVTVRELLVETRTAGTAILLSTHVLDIAERLSDRIAILDRGRLLHLEPAGSGAKARPASDRSQLETLYFQVTGRDGGERAES